MISRLVSSVVAMEISLRRVPEGPHFSELVASLTLASISDMLRTTLLLRDVAGEAALVGAGGQKGGGCGQIPHFPSFDGGVTCAGPEQLRAGGHQVLILPPRARFIAEGMGDVDEGRAMV